MTFKFPRGYLTFQEVRDRWQCSDNDLREAVASGALKPAIKTAAELKTPAWALDLDGNIFPFGGEIDCGGDGTPILSRCNQWLYLQKPFQNAPLNCIFYLASEERDPDEPEADGGQPEASWFWLPQKMNMPEVEADAVFTLEEISSFEMANSGQTKDDRNSKGELKSRERNAFLNIIAGLLALVQNPRPGRNSDMAVINELVENYGDKDGISERNLAKKFAQAKHCLAEK